MKKRTRHILLVVTLLLGLGSCGTSTFIFDDLVHSYRTCADGWDSPSIGRRGACSHHGGVVTRTIDNRTMPQKVLTYSLIAFGSISLLIALGLRASEDFHPAILIEGERANVPLTLAGETRQVEVIRVNEHSYRTVNDVALVRCPEGRRKSIYRMPLEFRGSKGKYRPNLSVWIYTGRGRAGGYYARAFQWSSNIH